MSPFPAYVLSRFLGDGDDDSSEMTHLSVDRNHGAASILIHEAAMSRQLRLVTAAILTRLANTTAYAQGDLLANHATAGNVVPIEANAPRYPGGEGLIKAVRLTKTGSDLTNAQFRVHFFKAAPTVSAGDNGVFGVTNGVARGYMGSVDVTLSQALGDGAFGRAAADLLFDCDKPSQKIYALIEVRGAYTPVSGEVFTLSLETERA